MPMRHTLVAALALVALLAGCATPAGTAPGAGQQADAITPGIWHVNGQTDVPLVWARNLDAEKADIPWSLTAVGGAPLPIGWTLAFNPPTASLAAAGTKVGSPPQYPDWSRSLVTVQLNASAQAGTFPLELRAGSAVTPILATVEQNLTRVSKAGDSVTVHYDGKFQESGKRFQEGDFSAIVGSGKTVPGFDGGLLGLALSEKTHLVLPAALAYGYDNGGPGPEFNGQALTFDVLIKKFG